MLNECATSAFQRQGSDRYIGYWSLLPRRATEPIAASLIINIAISEPLLKHKQKVWSQIWSDKEFKIDQTLRFPDFFYHTFESTCKNKGADGTARALRVVPALNKVGVLAALNLI